MPTARIVVVEDDSAIRRGVVDVLRASGYEVMEAADGAKGLEEAVRVGVDLLLLDLLLPRRDGLDVLADVRKIRPTLPVIILTARGTEEDRVRGLKMGADDYVVKPFSPRELVARVKALLRRANPLSEPESGGGAFEKGRLRMDFGTYQVFVDAKKRELALREFELLKFFVQHPMRVYTREQLLDMVWGRDTFVEPRTVDVHVRRLRQHIERDDANPELILTVRSVGYRFNPEALG